MSVSPTAPPTASVSFITVKKTGSKMQRPWLPKGLIYFVFYRLLLILLAGQNCATWQQYRHVGQLRGPGVPRQATLEFSPDETKRLGLKPVGGPHHTVAP